jgi:ADP-heptose:LPS heptosyltransferase
MQKLILKTFLSPGDVTVLTRAVADLHLAYPNQYLTDVRTSCNALFENNPYITPLDENEPEVRTIEMNYPSIHQSNARSPHFVCGYTQYLEDQLGLRIPCAAFRPEVYLTDQEKGWMSQVKELGWKKPFWIVVNGFKNDFTNKYWGHHNYQAVVDHFKGKIKFVQVGEMSFGHNHPKLENVIDLRGKTNPRQFCRLMYHATGLVCGVTFAYHLSAAILPKSGIPRPAVVLLGAREPLHWVSGYANQKIMATHGTLPCVDLGGGCWKSRVKKLNDGQDGDNSLCQFPAVTHGTTIPKCMHMIRPGDVIREIERFHENGVYRYLTTSALDNAR